MIKASSGPILPDLGTGPQGVFGVQLHAPKTTRERPLMAPLYVKAVLWPAFRLGDGPGTWLVRRAGFRGSGPAALESAGVPDCPPGPAFAPFLVGEHAAEDDVGQAASGWAVRFCRQVVAAV